MASINKCFNNITWTENLRRCVLATLLHPFAPFYEPKFNYACLFSRKPYCCLADDHCFMSQHQLASTIVTANFSKGYPSLLKDNIISTLNWTINQFLGNNLKSNYHEINSGTLVISNFLTKYAGYSWKTWLLPVQLVLCTTALSYYLIKDVKYLIYHFKARRRNCYR